MSSIFPVTHHPIAVYVFFLVLTSLLSFPLFFPQLGVLKIFCKQTDKSSGTTKLGSELTTKENRHGRI
jgi:hypothetical protein